MVTLTWSDALAILLPGVVVVVGLGRAHFNPWLADLVKDPANISAQAAVAIAVASTLAGGLLDGLRRVLFDFAPGKLPVVRAWLTRTDPPPEPKADSEPGGLYGFVTPENLELFQFLVQQSYKYYTFYGNLLLSLAILFVARRWVRPLMPVDGFLLAGIVVCALAARIQLGYFTTAMDGFRAVERRRRAEERSRVQKPSVP